MSQLIDELKTLESHMKALQEELKASKEKIAEFERKELEAQKSSETQQKETETQQKEQKNPKHFPDPTLPEDVFIACGNLREIQKIGEYIKEHGLRIGYNAIDFIWCSSDDYNDTILTLIKQDKDLGIFIVVKNNGNWCRLILKLDIFTGCDIIDLFLLHGNFIRVSSIREKLESTEVLDYLISKKCAKIEDLISNIMQSCRLTFDYYVKLNQTLKESYWPVITENFMRAIIEANVPYEKVAEIWKGRSGYQIHGASNTEKAFLQKYPDLAKHFAVLPLQIVYNIATDGSAIEFKEGRGTEFMKSLAEKIENPKYKLYFCVSFGLPFDLGIDSRTLHSEMVKDYCELTIAMSNPENLKTYLN